MYPLVYATNRPGTGFRILERRLEQLEHGYLASAEGESP
jgi:hypothetical protein